MTWLLFVFLGASLLVGFVVFFGPPYVPTLRGNMNTALDLLDLKEGDTMLELGCGDGRVLLAAAKRGAKVVGIELSPVLALVAWLRTVRYRKRVRVICGNYFLVTWPPATKIFTFMIPRQMAKLDKRIEHWRTGPVQLASFAFQIPGKKPHTVHGGVYLYRYK